MKKINYVNSVQKSVNSEFNDFKESELKKTKNEIFNDYYQIYFYEEMSNFLINNDDSLLDTLHWECLNQDKGNILNFMYQYYLKNEYASINNYEDLTDLVVEYNNKFHHNILNKESIAE